MAVSHFAKSLTAMLAVIEAVDYSLYQGRQRDNWLIEKLESSSPTVRMYPSRNGVDAVTVIGSGLRHLHEDSLEPPPHFTEAALKNLGKMGVLFAEKGLLASIDVLMDEEHAATISKTTAENAKKTLKSGYANLGSIQGRLEALNIHGSPKGTVWDRVTGTPVQFGFARADVERIKTLVNRRVLISGMVSYFENGTPRAIADVIDIADVSRKEFADTAGFGSVPDERVRELGGERVLQSIWERMEN